ncbi:MAG: hypothetical protein MUC88_04415 [Planctomycetes bacterium]|nr:hypothetical protein [Planctomycetota bacterium]
MSMVFYDEKGAPSKYTTALSETEFGRIVNVVSARAKTAVWFLRAQPSFLEEHGPVIVYLVPQKQTPRIRVGNAYVAWLTRGEVVLHPRSPFVYTQVSQWGHPFTGELTLPSVRDLPFTLHTGSGSASKELAQIPEEEVIRIADSVREPSSYEGLSLPRRPTWDRMARETLELPILKMYRQGNKIHVRLGFQLDGTWGHGREVALEGTSTGYKIVDWDEWIS